MTHETTLSGTDGYLLPAWIGTVVVLISTALIWMGCGWLQSKGYMLLPNDQQVLTCAILGLGFGMTSFLSAIDSEIRFRLQMTVLKDRQCGWGEFRIVNRVWLRPQTSAAWWKRPRLASRPQVHG